MRIKKEDMKGIILFNLVEQFLRIKFTNYFEYVFYKII